LQARLLGVGGAGVAVLQVGEDATGLVGITRLDGLFELLVHDRRLGSLGTLPRVPAVQPCKGAQHQHDGPGDEVAVLLPERLQLVELFLFLQIEIACHEPSGPQGP
jgi:hypothetical protein